MAILKGIISKLNGSAGNLTFKQLGGTEAPSCGQDRKKKGSVSIAASALRAFQGIMGRR